MLLLEVALARLVARREAAALLWLEVEGGGVARGWKGFDARLRGYVGLEGEWAPCVVSCGTPR